jgi:hypothetical protein
VKWTKATNSDVARAQGKYDAEHGILMKTPEALDALYKHLPDYPRHLRSVMRRAYCRMYRMTSESMRVMQKQPYRDDGADAPF